MAAGEQSLYMFDEDTVRRIIRELVRAEHLYQNELGTVRRNDDKVLFRLKKGYLDEDLIGDGPVDMSVAIGNSADDEKTIAVHGFIIPTSKKLEAGSKVIAGLMNGEWQVIASDSCVVDNEE